jgi:hypothetical protein
MIAAIHSHVSPHAAVKSHQEINPVLVIVPFRAWFRPLDKIRRTSKLEARTPHDS